MIGFLGLPGGWEWVIIVLAILLLFGGKKLPELARGLGKGLRLFKKELRDTTNAVGEGYDESDSSESKSDSPSSDTSNDTDD